MDRQKPHKAQQKEIQSPMAEEKQLHTPEHTGDRPAGKQHDRGPPDPVM